LTVRNSETGVRRQTIGIGGGSFIGTRRICSALRGIMPAIFDVGLIVCPLLRKRVAEAASTVCASRRVERRLGKFLVE
jgi:hypothetical protein